MYTRTTQVHDPVALTAGSFQGQNFVAVMGHIPPHDYPAFKVFEWGKSSIGYLTKKYDQISKDGTALHLASDGWLYVAQGSGQGLIKAHEPLTFVYHHLADSVGVSIRAISSSPDGRFLLACAGGLVSMVDTEQKLPGQEFFEPLSDEALACKMGAVGRAVLIAQQQITQWEVWPRFGLMHKQIPLSGPDLPVTYAAISDNLEIAVFVKVGASQQAAHLSTIHATSTDGQPNKQLFSHTSRKDENHTVVNTLHGVIVDLAISPGGTRVGYATRERVFIRKPDGFWINEFPVWDHSRPDNMIRKICIPDESSIFIATTEGDLILKDIRHRPQP